MIAFFFSASLNAVKIEGVKYLTLENLIADYPESCRIANSFFTTETQYVNSEDIKKLFSEITSDLYQYSQQLKNSIDSISEWTQENISELKFLIEKILNSYPFFKYFLLMTEIVLDRKHITQNNPEYFRHISFCLLQSVYFMIRELQKVQKRNEFDVKNL